MKAFDEISRKSLDDVHSLQTALDNSISKEFETAKREASLKTELGNMASLLETESKEKE